MASDQEPRVLQYELADDDAESEEEMHPASAAAARVMAAHPNDIHRLDLAIRTGVASPYALGAEDIHIPPSDIRGLISEMHHPRPHPSQPPNAWYDPHPSQPPTQPCQPGTHFTACLRLSDNTLRVDHTGYPGFWLQVKLPDDLMEAYVAWKYRPDGAVARRAAESFERRMGDSVGSKP